MRRERCSIKYISEYVLSIAGVIILNVLIESVMPSNAFKKYIKAVMGLIIVAVLAKPVLNFTDFEMNIDKYVLSKDFNIEENNEIEVFFDNQIKNEFEKKLCESIKNDVLQNFNAECFVFANFENGSIKSIRLKCDEEKFEGIKSFIDKKYDVNCEKY